MTRLLFLTSKVRLHCGVTLICMGVGELILFLTSKVRLHCGSGGSPRICETPATFPDLKGQAPLRLENLSAFTGGRLAFS